MVALNEELSGIAEEPQARSGCGAAEGAMTFPPKNQSNPRSVPYCSDSYFPGSDFSRHYARKRNYSPSLESVLRQELKSRLSTGVAHREINQDPAGYPGAAALSRGVGTGFHGADAEHNCGEHRSLPLNINGANTYQFVLSNPVGNVDPWGASILQQLAGSPITGAYKLPPSNTPDCWPGANPFDMLSHWYQGSGAPVIITGPPFIDNVKRSPALEAEVKQFKRQLKRKIKAAARRLSSGKTTVVTNRDLHFTYTILGYRWAGFGEIHLNITASITVNKGRTGRVTYSGNIDFHGYDRYQWGTAMHRPWPIYWAGDIINTTGTPFNSSWSWTESFNRAE